MKRCSGNNRLEDMDSGLGSKGAVSPMLCIVTACFMFINFVFWDYITVSHQKLLAQRINDLACSSVMSDFDSTFENYYGLYCLDTSKKNSYLTRYYEIIKENNLNVKAELLSYDKLDEYYVSPRRVGEYSLAFYDHLDQENVLQREIRDLMSKRSIGNFAEFIAERIALLCDLKNDADVYRHLNDFDGTYETIKALLRELEPLLNGFEGIPFSGVNGFDADSFIANMQVLTNGVAGNFTNGIIPADEKGADAVKTSMAPLLLPVYVYSEYCRQARDTALKILRSTEKAELSLANAKKASESSDVQDKDEIERRLESCRKKLSSLGNYNEICQKLENNIVNFDTVLNAQNRFEATAADSDVIRFEDVKRVIDKAEYAYKNYCFVTVIIPAEEETADTAPLKKLYDKAVEAAGVFLDFMPQDNTEIDEELYKKLPSKKAGITESPELGSSVTVESIENLYGESLGKYSDTFDNADSGSILDYYYIDDYVMSYFASSAVDKRPASYSYMNGEIEYIIFGGRTDDGNLTAAYSSIFGLRTTLNMLHILRDEDKMERIESVSDHPVLIALLVTIWSLFESAFDIYKLRDGDTVPLVKTDDDWSCDLDGTARQVEEIISGEESNNITSMSYTDYLGILLALTGYRTKLLRIRDILELNYWKVNRVYRDLSEFAAGVALKSEIMIDTVVFRNILHEKKGRFYIETYNSY
ncbi:MAG: hypothetical protein J6112_03785 [Clostridia bacterium]|nr:hypothetical protein [Clostridia bacterium]